MKINEELLLKANKIIKLKKIEDDKKLKEQQKLLEEKKSLKKYKKICIEAKICPICGGVLNSRKSTKKERKESGYNWDIKTIYCEDKESHFTEVIGEYIDHNDEY